MKRQIIKSEKGSYSSQRYRLVSKHNTREEWWTQPHGPSSRSPNLVLEDQGWLAEGYVDVGSDQSPVSSCDRYNNGPQVDPHPDPRNLWMCYVIWQGRMKFVDRIKFANQLILRWRDYPGGPSVIPSVLTKARGSESEWWDGRKTQWAIPGFEDEGKSHKPRNASSL